MHDVHSLVQYQSVVILQSTHLGLRLNGSHIPLTHKL